MRGLFKPNKSDCTGFFYIIVLVSMNSRLEKIFKNTSDLEPSAGLKGFILVKIEAIGARQAQRKLAFSYTGIAVSIFAVFYSVAVFGEGVIKSEFFSLVSLVFSDLGIVLANWKDFSYSLLETFPVIYAAVIIAPIFTLLLSFNAYLNNHNPNRHYNTT